MINEEEEKEESIYWLINSLCYSVIQQQSVASSSILENEKFLANLRAKCFEILLKKSNGYAKSNCNSDDEDRKFNPLRAFDVHIFALNLMSNIEHIDCEQLVKDFEEARNAVAQEPYFLDAPGSEIIKFLFKLQPDPLEEKIVPLSREPELLVPEAFKLHTNYSKSPYFAKNRTNIQDVLVPRPKFFKGIEVLGDAENPYLPKFFVNGETNLLSAIDKKYNKTVPPASKQQIEKCTFTAMTQRLFCTDEFSSSIGSRGLGFRSTNLNSANNKTVTKALEAPVEIRPLVKKEIEFVPRRALSWVWEQLGCFGINCTRPFASDVNVVHDLQSLIQHANFQTFEAKILSREQFMRDLKLLTVGIQSDSFRHNKLLIFKMEDNITVEDLLPETVKHFVEQFLECGTCYKRLQMMIMKKDYKLMFEGFIFKAICTAIDEYLLTFRQFVYAYENEKLIAFYDRMKNQMRQISNLTYTFGIHPTVHENLKPPMGSQFLGYIYHEIIRLTDNAYITLLMFIMKRCCHVYFKYLQKWIFYGILDDPSNELFISFVEQYRPQTKYFYDKAYFVRKESVPGFFQNYEDRILQCGKYTMLLKACKPNHPLFALEYPTISVRLSFEEIKALEVSCAKYAEVAREKCGKPVSFRSLFEARAQKKQTFYRMVQQAARKNTEEFVSEQNHKSAELAEIKRKQLAELNEQINETKQRRVEERRANIELELGLLREAEKREEQRLVEENIRIQNRLEYYRELCATPENGTAVGVECAANNAEGSSGTASSVPISPVSVITISTTDYESCCEGEEEEKEKQGNNGSPQSNSFSDYAECKSQDSKDVPLPVVSDPSTTTEGDPQTKQSKSQDKVSNDNDAESLYTLRVGMKRSISDILNSNEPAVKNEGLSDMQRNRLRVLGVSDTDSAPTSGIEADFKVPLTEAQKNKLKVLTEEYNFRTERKETMLAKSLPDINLNVQTQEKELTDLQRNRKRMMENDLFCEYNRDPMAERAKLKLNLNTDCARNRRRVLESEFNILSGEQNYGVGALTPMSTTSDPPLSDGGPPSERSKASEPGSDKLSTSNLRVDIDLVTQDRASITGESASATGIPLVTPLSALNTAGILARAEGFTFEVPAKPQQNPDLNAAADTSTMPADNDVDDEADLTDANTSVDKKKYGLHDEPYARCLELLASNFQCPQHSPYIRWKPPEQSRQVENGSKADAGNSSLKHFKMNSLSVITLTEFLQKSVIIPMNAYFELVNNEVMRLFLEDLNLMEHFRSLRHYFFLMNGEFGSLICDGIITRIESGAMPSKVLSFQGLHSVLDTALALSMGKDKNAERLSFLVADVPQKFELPNPNVLSLLTLSYRVEYPLNLVLTSDIMEKYAVIFRHLMKLERINWVLERSYQLLKEAVKTHGTTLLRSPQYLHIQQMRHKFYHFINALQHHITSNALQSSWKVLKDDLLNAVCLEDIYRMHRSYIKRILFLCMLNEQSSKFYEGIQNILKVTLRFYYNLKSHPFTIRLPNTHFTHPRYSRLQKDEEDFEKCLKFIIYLGNKIVQRGYQSEIREFLNLINFNEYYTATPEEVKGMHSNKTPGKS